MPKYPANPTYVSGFHNNKNTNGVNDRVYSALDMREPYKSIFSDGVKPNANGVLGDDLQVQAVSGMQIRVAAGRGLFGGAFFYNKSIYTIELDTASSTDRYDCVIVRTDDATDRNTTIYIKSLTHVPTIDDLERTDDVNEYCLGYVYVPALAISITDANITDTRLNQNLCGVITGVFNQVDGEALNRKFEDAFNNWFEDIKVSFVAGATLIHTYDNHVVTTTTGQTEVEIGIPQYNMNTDTLLVSVNGNVFSKGTQYTIVDNTKVRFTLGFRVVGTEVLFQVFKSVDGSQAETLSSQVNTLINQMNDVNKKLEFDYLCNGINDNIQLSNLVKTFLSKNDHKLMKLRVIGNFGATTPYSDQTGTDTNNPEEYVRWFDFGASTNRRFILDFSNCSPITLTLENNKNHVIFYGSHQDIENCVLKAGSITNTGTQILGTYGKGDVVHKDCKYSFICANSCALTRNGRFDNCEVTLISKNNNAIAFYTDPASCVCEVNGGIYWLYTGSNVSSDYGTKLVFHSQTTNSTSPTYTAVTILDNVRVPNASLTIDGISLKQDGVIFRTNSNAGGYIRCNNLITTSDRMTNNSIDASTKAVIGEIIPLSRAKAQSPFV